MKAVRVKADPVLARRIIGVDGDGNEFDRPAKGILVLDVRASDEKDVRRFLSWYYAKHDGKGVAIDIGVWRNPRTLDQNRLMWALLRIMSFEVYAEFGHHETLYQDMLDLYAPKEVSELSGKVRNVTSSEMDTVEMARMIEGVFMELADLPDLEVESAADIGRYWEQWYSWRGESDPLADRQESVEEYRRKIRFCEACRDYIRDSGEVAHIASRGSGGGDAGWNLMRLCIECHRMIQHQHGWADLMKRHPHITGRVKAARARAGKREMEE